MIIINQLKKNLPAGEGKLLYCRQRKRMADNQQFMMLLNQ